jgi:Aerolysin toxin/Aerolysin/Pertussis toxin (APT) domain
MIKSLITIGVLYSIGSTVANASAIYPEQLKIDSGQCASDYRALTKTEAERYNDVIVNKMGQWQITALADNWVIMGGGYSGEIKRGTAGKTWCYPNSPKVDIPTRSALYVPAGTAYQVEDELMAEKNNFIKPLSYLAHYMGFAWVGGNGSNYVGEDMDINLGADHTYEIKGSNDGSCSGYRCDEKSTITVSNFQYVMDVDSFTAVENRVVTDKELIDTVTGTGTNRLSIPQVMTVFLEYTNGTSWSQSNDTSVSGSVTLENTWKSPSVTGGADTSVSVTVTAGHTWGESTSETNTDKVRVGYQTVVPAYTQVDASIEVYKASISYPYEFDADIYYDLAINGFMRWGGNALLSHPENRPNETANFAIGHWAGEEKSIEHQWEHRNIPGVNTKWDWPWMIQQNGLSTIEYRLSQVLRPLKTTINGTFYAEKQYASEVEWGNERSMLQSQNIEQSAVTSSRNKRSTSDISANDNISTSDSIKQQLEDAGFKDVKVSVTMTPLAETSQE